MTLDQDIAVLATLVQRMAEESGRLKDFDSRAWLDQWLVQFVPALGNRRPLDVLDEPDGLESVRSVLLRMQSGACF